MLNTVFRQVSFFLFERELHDMRAIGELSDEDISELWMSSQKESLQYLPENSGTKLLQ